MRQPIFDDDLGSPGTILNRMIADYVRGNLDFQPTFYRVLVVAIDLVGGQFETSPTNPQNAIKGRIISYGMDSVTPDDDLPIFWPMHEFTQSPIKEGEHVYVTFEDDAKTHGLWWGRIPQQFGLNSKNYAAGRTPYLQKTSNNVTNLSVDQVLAQTSTSPQPDQISSEFQVEDVPNFISRIGDHVIFGSNDVTIVLGRDRPNTKQSGVGGAGAGTIDIVAGRASGSTDMDTLNDSTRVYVSKKTDVDANFGTDSIGQNAPQGPAAAIISDEVRIVGRNGMKIVVKNGTLTIEGTNINIGNNADQAVALGNNLKDLLQQLITAIGAITVTASPAPNAPAVAIPIANIADFVTPTSIFTTPLESLLSNTVKVKA